MTAILKFDRVTFRYPGQDRPALHDLNLVLPAEEKVAIIGRNGSGKSTLFLHCNGLYRPASGTVSFSGRPLAYDRGALLSLRQRVGIVFQNPDDQLFSASVAQDISFGPLNLGLGEAETRRRVAAAAELCEVTHLLQRPTHALSGGEKARVALAGVLAMEPDVLIIDEIMGSLDPWVRQGVMAILEQLHARAKTILLATHDLAIVQGWASLVVVLADGQVLFAGPTEKLLTDQGLMERTGLSTIWGSASSTQGEGRL